MAAQPCQFPSGLALDVQKHRLFAACDNRLLAVVDAATGKLPSTVFIGKGPDAAGFDPNTRVAFSSNGDRTLTVIGERGAGYTVIHDYSKLAS